MDEITTQHGGIEIRYDEYGNRWRFELNGREHAVESLSQARERIDKQPRSKKNFKRFEAYCGLFSPIGGDFEKVIVTSQAENLDYRKRVQWWVLDSDGKRFKASSLYLADEANAAIVLQIAQVKQSIKELIGKGTELAAKLTPLCPAPPTDTESK